MFILKQLFLNLILLACITGNASYSYAVDYPYKSVKDLKTLESFKSVDEFEKDYKAYIQDCLDHTFGGTGGIPCLVEDEIWDRELNLSYEKLIKILDAQSLKALKASQKAWIKEKNMSMEFVARLLDKKYKGQEGTMYILTRAGDTRAALTPIIKQRTLVLMQWIEMIKTKI